jgi:hypothetical protein
MDKHLFTLSVLTHSQLTTAVIVEHNLDPEPAGSAILIEDDEGDLLLLNEDGTYTIEDYITEYKLNGIVTFEPASIDELTNLCNVSDAELRETATKHYPQIAPYCMGAVVV